MKVQKVLALIEILAVTSLVSVGFSSWTIVVSDSATLNGVVNVENVTNYNNYMNVNNMIFSEYTDSGFYTNFSASGENGTISKVGTLVAEVEVDLDKYVTDFGSFTNLSFDFELTCHTTRIRLFNLANSVTMTYDYFVDSGTVTKNNSPISSELTNSIKKDTVNIACSTTGTLFVHLFYKIDLTDGFESFYNYATEYGSLEFKLVAVLEGGNS